MLDGKPFAQTTSEEAETNYSKGSDYLKKDMLDKAEKYLLKALEYDPLFIDAMDHLGLVYRRQKRYDDAVQIYLKSISTNNTLFTVVDTQGSL